MTQQTPTAQHSDHQTTQPVDNTLAHYHQRLEQMNQEYELGKEQLTTLEGRSEELRATMLRISGAMQVLQELITHHPHTIASPTPDQHTINSPLSDNPSAPEPVGQQEHQSQTEDKHKVLTEQELVIEE